MIGDVDDTPVGAGEHPAVEVFDSKRFGVRRSQSISEPLSLRCSLAGCFVEAWIPTTSDPWDSNARRSDHTQELDH